MGDKAETEEKVDYSKLKVPDLKKILKERGLSTSGNKMDLIERLTTKSDELGDELLDESATGDSDLEHELSSTSNITDQGCTSKKRQIDGVESLQDTPKAKLIRTNEKEQTSEDAAEDELIGVNVNGTEKKENEKSSENGGSRIIKLCGLTQEERIAKRAEKFGLTEEAKKQLRAIKFGTSTKPTATTDALQKRAIKFGAISPAVKSLELQEKMEKRKLKFSSPSSAPSSLPDNIQSMTAEQRKLWRAQKFKLST